MLGYLCISASWAVLHPLILIVLIVLIRAFYLTVAARFGLDRSIEASWRSISLPRSACTGAVSTETTLALRSSVAVALITLALRSSVTVSLIAALPLRSCLAVTLIASLALRSCLAVCRCTAGDRTYAASKL